MCFGGFIAVFFSKLGTLNHYKTIKIIAFSVFGLLLLHYSSFALVTLDKWFEIPLFMRSASYNFLFNRLGDVFILFGLFYTFESYLKQDIVTRIGQKTLSIYVIHFIIIYGSFTGLGLKRFLYQSLTPAEAIIGATLFMIVVCVISFYYVRTNTYIYGKIRNLYYKLKN